MAIWLLASEGLFPLARFASACELPGDAGRLDILFFGGNSWLGQVEEAK